MFHRGYNEELAHLIEAASDMFLMPSLYEPCGLNQMYSLKYGTVADRAAHRRPRGLGAARGIRRRAGAPASCSTTSTRRRCAGRSHAALDFFKDRDGWLQMMRNGMAQDFSWDRQSRRVREALRAGHLTCNCRDCTVPVSWNGIFFAMLMSVSTLPSTT